MPTDASPLPPTGQADAATSPELTQPPVTPDAPASTTDKPAATNLHDDPNFRKLQSQYEKRLAEQAKRLADLERQQEERALAEMDDVDRLKYERDKFARQLEERDQAAAVEQQKRAILTEISQRSGIPVEELAESESAYDAALLALERLRRGGRERAEASRVDLGGGRANTPADRVEVAAREAFQQRDPAAYIRALREAQT